MPRIAAAAAASFALALGGLALMLVGELVALEALVVAGGWMTTPLTILMGLLVLAYCVTALCSAALAATRALRCRRR